MIRQLGSILLALSSLTLLSNAPSVNFSAVVEEGSAIPSEVKIGTELTAAMIDIEHGGETKKASSCLIHTPSGAKKDSNHIVFSEAGKYAFEFIASFGEEQVSKTVETISVRTPNSMFSGSNASYAEGSFAYADQLDSSVGVSDYKGIKVNSRDGGTVTFQKVLDLSGASKDTPLIDFIVEPSTLGAYDVGEIVITLTDADDPNNKVDIRYVDGLAGSGREMRLTYATARATGQYYAGYENWSGYWHINNDQTGAPTFLTLRGLDQQIISDFGVGYLNSQLFFDYPSKQIFVRSEYSAVNSTVLVNDLDSTAVYPANPWSGFKNNRAIMSIATKDVSGGGAKYVIKSILGYDFSEELLRDTASPLLRVDYDGNDKDALPFAKKDHTYPIFTVDAFDDFDDDLILHKRVQFVDSGNGALIDIANDGRRFTASYYGTYKVSYYCSDRSGNEAEECYYVHCSPAPRPEIEIVVPEDASSYRAFDTISLPSLDEITVRNTQGKVKLRRYLIDPTGASSELIRDYFTPTTIGLYQVKYVAEDIYEAPVAAFADYDIRNIDRPLITERIALPEIMVKGQYYELPRVSCKYPDGDAMADGDVPIYVNGVLFQENRLYVESLDDIRIDYVPHDSLEDKRSFTVKVVEGTDENGHTLKGNYFHSEDSSYLVESVKNKALQFTLNSSAEVHFIKTLSANDLSFSFGLNEETMLNYSAFRVRISDKYDSSKSLTLRAETYGNGMRLYVPFDPIAKDLSCDEERQFEVYYRPYNKVLRDRNYQDICQIKYYDSGEPFEGFSDEVSVSFGFEGLLSPAKVSLVFLNNQSFKSSIARDNAGPQIITDSNLNWANELGQEITISKAKAFDVLSYVKYLYVSVTDSNGSRILDQVDASTDHKITLNRYGNYRIEYYSEDGNGRTSSRSYTICCIENELPELNVQFSPKESYAVGEVFSIPSFSFNDNSKNCTLDISLYLPDGQGIAVEHDRMIDGEIHRERYLNPERYSSELVNDSNSIKLYRAGKFILRFLVVDAYGNVKRQEFTLNVR